MAQIDYDVFRSRNRSNWVRMRTLAQLRWFAVAGQIGAVLVATYIFKLSLEIGLIAVVIGLPVIVNIVTHFIYPENQRLSESQSAAMIGFDLIQLGVLLFLTGGLDNPFAVLILAPVTVASTILPLRSALILGAISLVIVTALWFVSQPIMTDTGLPLILPDLFVFGFWAALMIGVVFVAIYARQVTQETLSMSEALVAAQMALAREQKLTDLGGVVAAAAHELGTPLATIKLVSSELIDELADHDDLREDAMLIREQADRCRDILRSMGRAGKEDNLLRIAPIETVIKEASEPHLGRGKTVEFTIGSSPEDATRQPDIFRRPEIIHGVRNFIQNAVDFANTAVLVEVTWTDDRIGLRISDDGPGFPPTVIGRIGEPFVRERRPDDTNPERPEYEGMGLGLFIAKTLLERSGATLQFSNGGIGEQARKHSGAIVTVDWARASIQASKAQTRGALGDNILIT